jgi:hypothetical protein
LTAPQFVVRSRVIIYQNLDNLNNLLLSDISDFAIGMSFTSSDAEEYELLGGGGSVIAVSSALVVSHETKKRTSTEMSNPRLNQQELNGDHSW